MRGAGFSGGDDGDDVLSVEGGGDGGGVGGSPDVLVGPKGFSVGEIEGGDAGARGFIFLAADVDDEAVLVDEGIGSVSEEVLGDAEFFGEIAFPENFSGFEVEAVEHGGDSDEVDFSVVDDGAGAGAGGEAVAIAVFDGVGESPVAPAGLGVEAIEGFPGIGGVEVEEAAIGDDG